MEYTDIIFSGMDAAYIDCFLKNELEVSQSNIISSHFFKYNIGDFDYSDNIIMSKYFSDVATCNMHLSKINMGIHFDDVVIVIVSDEKDLDITISIANSQINQIAHDDELRDYLLVIGEKYKLRKIIIDPDDSNSTIIYEIE